MNSELITGFLGGGLLAFGASFVYVHSLLKKHQIKQDELVKNHKAELSKASENGLSVIAFPYKEEHGDDGWISDDRSAKVGYQYQLFINGVPCFEAHKVVVEELTKKQVSPAKIERALAHALQLIEVIASKHPAIQVAKAAQKTIVHPE